MEGLIWWTYDIPKEEVARIVKDLGLSFSAQNLFNECEKATYVRTREDDSGLAFRYIAGSLSTEKECFENWLSSGYKEVDFRNLVGIL